MVSKQSQHGYIRVRECFEHCFVSFVTRSQRKNLRKNLNSLHLHVYKAEVLCILLTKMLLLLLYDNPFCRKTCLAVIKKTAVLLGKWKIRLTPLFLLVLGSKTKTFCSSSKKFKSKQSFEIYLTANLSLGIHDQDKLSQQLFRNKTKLCVIILPCCEKSA